MLIRGCDGRPALWSLLQLLARHDDYAIKSLVYRTMSWCMMLWPEELSDMMLLSIHSLMRDTMNMSSAVRCMSYRTLQLVCSLRPELFEYHQQPFNKLRTSHVPRDRCVALVSILSHHHSELDLLDGKRKAHANTLGALKYFAIQVSETAELVRATLHDRHLQDPDTMAQAIVCLMQMQQVPDLSRLEVSISSEYTDGMRESQRVMARELPILKPRSRDARVAKWASYATVFGVTPAHWSGFIVRVDKRNFVSVCCRLDQLLEHDSGHSRSIANNGAAIAESQSLVTALPTSALLLSLAEAVRRTVISPHSDGDDHDDHQEEEALDEWRSASDIAIMYSQVRAVAEPYLDHPHTSCVQAAMHVLMALLLARAIQRHGPPLEQPADADDGHLVPPLREPRLYQLVAHAAASQLCTPYIETQLVMLVDLDQWLQLLPTESYAIVSHRLQALHHAMHYCCKVPEVPSVQLLPRTRQLLLLSRRRLAARVYDRLQRMHEIAREQAYDSLDSE